MAYDAFAHLPIYTLEDLGFVGRGEAGAFIEDGHTSPGGSLPMNTNGGGLSYTHTGVYGMFVMQESIRQVRGEAAAQVPGVNISVAHGVGSMFTSASTLVFGYNRGGRGPAMSDPAKREKPAPVVTPETRPFWECGPRSTSSTSNGATPASSTISTRRPVLPGLLLRGRRLAPGKRARHSACPT